MNTGFEAKRLAALIGILVLVIVIIAGLLPFVYKGPTPKTITCPCLTNQEIFSLVNQSYNNQDGYNISVFYQSQIDPNVTISEGWIVDAGEIKISTTSYHGDWMVSEIVYQTDKPQEFYDFELNSMENQSNTSSPYVQNATINNMTYSYFTKPGVLLALKGNDVVYLFISATPYEPSASKIVNVVSLTLQ